MGYYQDEITAESSRVNESIATIFFGSQLYQCLWLQRECLHLVSLTVLKRMKEIAIRKVVGASGNHIFNLVMKGYFWIFLLAAGLGLLCRLCTFQIINGYDIQDQLRCEI